MCHIYITFYDASQVQRTSFANPSLLSQIRNYLLCTGRDFTASREYLPALRVRSMGGRLAQEMGARRSDGCPLRGRHHLRIPTPSRSRSFSGKLSGTTRKVWIGITL